MPHHCRQPGRLVRGLSLAAGSPSEAPAPLPNWDSGPARCVGCENRDLRFLFLVRYPGDGIPLWSRDLEVEPFIAGLTSKRLASERLSPRVPPRSRLEPRSLPERRARNTRTSTAHSIRRPRASGRFRASTPQEVIDRPVRLHAPPPSRPWRGDRRRGGATPRSSCSKTNPTLARSKTPVRSS